MYSSKFILCFSVLHQSVCFAARLGYIQISSISILTEEENLRRIVTIFTKLQKMSLKSDVKLWFAVFPYRELHVYLLQVAIQNIYNGIYLHVFHVTCMLPKLGEFECGRRPIKSRLFYMMYKFQTFHFDIL